MPTRKPDAPSKLVKLYNVEQAAALLLSLGGDEESDRPVTEAGQRWLRDGANHKGFPHYRVGRRLMFSEANLVAIHEDFCSVPATYRRPRRTTRTPRKPVASAA